MIIPYLLLILALLGIVLSVVSKIRGDRLDARPHNWDEIPLDVQKFSR